VSQGENRMGGNHPGTGEFHNISDLSSHVRFIAMYGTFAAYGLVFAEGAFERLLSGIFVKFLASIAALVCTVMTSAKHVDHDFHSPDFSFYSFQIPVSLAFGCLSHMEDGPL
jgi:hypothetical protein